MMITSTSLQVVLIQSRQDVNNQFVGTEYILLLQERLFFVVLYSALGRHSMMVIALLIMMDHFNLEILT